MATSDAQTREEIDRRVKRADDLAQAARSSWFVMLGALAFAAIAVAGVADRDFFLADVATELPIVGVSVPTVGFFVAAPIILLAVYANFQFYVLKLWTALAEIPPALPPEVSGRPVPLARGAFAVAACRCGDRAQARLASDAVRAPGSSAVALPRLGLAAPLVLAAFWFRSWPYHHSLLSAGIAVAPGSRPRAWLRDVFHWTVQPASGVPARWFCLASECLAWRPALSCVLTVLAVATLAAIKVDIAWAGVARPMACRPLPCRGSRRPDGLDSPSTG